MTGAAGGGHDRGRRRAGPGGRLRDHRFAGTTKLGTASSAVLAGCALVVGALALWLLAPTVPSAQAPERTDVESVLDSVSPPLPAGVDVRTAPSVAQPGTYVATNTSTLDTVDTVHGEHSAARPLAA